MHIISNAGMKAILGLDALYEFSFIFHSHRASHKLMDIRMLVALTKCGI